MKCRTRSSKQNLPQLVNHCRQGAFMVVAAILMIVILVFVALSVDIGYISLTKAEMQNAVDAAALAGASELAAGLRSGDSAVWIDAETAARDAAVNLAFANRNGDSQMTSVNAVRDIRVGQRSWNESTGLWETTWGTTPSNLIEVRARRHVTDGNQLPLFIAGVFGTNKADLNAVAAAGVNAAGGFRYNRQSARNVMLLPFTVDLDSWSQVLNGMSYDGLSWDGVNVLAKSDGVHEINIYPSTDNTVPAGNRGTLNLGSPSNSTFDISRQILYGLNESDMSYYGGEIRVDDGPVYFTGDPGLSQGFEDELLAIVGQRRIIPLFTEVTGKGGRAEFKIVRFAGCRIMAVNLQGSLKTKYLIVQPESYVDSTSVSSRLDFFQDSLIAPPKLVF